jgi:hypothetical protein
MDAVLTTVMGLAAVGLGGVAYQTYYEVSDDIVMVSGYINVSTFQELDKLQMVLGIISFVFSGMKHTEYIWLSCGPRN